MRKIPKRLLEGVEELEVEVANMSVSEGLKMAHIGCVEYISATEQIEHMMPRAEHIIKRGKVLWYPSVAPTLSGATVGIMGHNNSSDPLYIADEWRAINPNPHKVTFNAYSSVTYSGLSIQIPEDGLMQLLVNIGNGALKPFDIILTNENGSVHRTTYNNGF